MVQFLDGEDVAPVLHAITAPAARRDGMSCMTAG
jgi:hypothetical protein